MSKYIPGNPTKGNFILLFISPHVKFTLANIILSLGNYTLFKFLLGNPTKGNLTTRRSKIARVTMF